MNTISRRGFLTRVGAMVVAAAVAPEVMEAEAKKFFALDKTMMRERVVLHPLSDGYVIDEGEWLHEDRSEELRQYTFDPDLKLSPLITDQRLLPGDIVAFDARNGKYRKARGRWEAGITHFGVWDGKRVWTGMPVGAAINEKRLRGEW